MLRRVLRSFTFAGEGMGWLCLGIALPLVGLLLGIEPVGWIGGACFVLIAIVCFGGLRPDE